MSSVFPPSSLDYPLLQTESRQKIGALCDPQFNMRSEEGIDGAQLVTPLVSSDVQKQVFSILKNQRISKHSKRLSPKRRAALRSRKYQITESLHQAEMQSEVIV